MNDTTDGRARNIYELTGVHKHFGSGTSLVRALDGVQLTVAEGEFLAIQGPTGQGKSTLLTLLGGLDRPTSGEVLFDGQALQTLGEAEIAHLRAHAFGFVFQTFNLIPTLTAQENVETALVPLAVAAKDRRERARETLHDLGLADRASHLPHELSGGQQQRVAIARALVKDPRVLLADEPTGNLDEQTRDEIVGLLEGLWRNRGLTMVVVTHDSAIAHRAQRIATIKGGRVSAASQDGAGERADNGRAPAESPPRARRRTGGVLARAANRAMNWRAVSARKPTTYLAVCVTVAALAIGGCASGSSGSANTSRSGGPNGRFPGHFGTPVTGATATKVGAAARAKYKGTVRRVLKLPNGSYIALVITPQGPYRVTVNNNYKVTGARQFTPPAGAPPGS